MTAMVKLFIMTVIGMMSLLCSTGSVFGQDWGQFASKDGMYYFPAMEDTLFVYKGTEIHADAKYVKPGEPMVWINDEEELETNGFNLLIRAVGSDIVFQPDMSMWFVVEEGDSFEFDWGFEQTSLIVPKGTVLQVVPPTSENRELFKKTMAPWESGEDEDFDE